MEFSIKDFFSKCDQIRSFLRIWSHLLDKSLMENFIFCAVIIKVFVAQSCFLVALLCLWGKQQFFGFKHDIYDQWFYNFPDNAFERAEFWCIVGLRKNFTFL